MKIIDLTGSWQFWKRGDKERLPAIVPGCVHLDLLASKKIKDPFFRDNESSLFWIGESDWLYSREFEVDRAFSECKRMLLVCDGLDTLATIRINGKKVGTADNQFSSWIYDVRPYLRSGTNNIEILFASTFPSIRQQQKNRPLAPVNDKKDRIMGGNRVRKSQCNYGWDWGPKCVTCGIWKPIRLVAYNTGRISDLVIIQRHGKANRVTIDIETAVDRPVRTPLVVSCSIRMGKKRIATCRIPVDKGRAAASLTVDNARLWWPNGLGKQPLYEVTVELLSEQKKKVLDRQTRSIGLRTLKLIQKEDKWGTSFAFEVNGVKFFSKGANWIPADTFLPRVSPEHYERLIRSSAEANMNMLRVWGGGIYENDIFYDLCDKYGICVWQDFMFACSAYPAFDPVFMKNVEKEASDNVKRLRHHPCLAVWCGNNEIEQIKSLVGNGPGQMTWREYKNLFDKMLSGVVRSLDPSRAYWPSSPHSPSGDREDHNNPRCGDAHLWDVWHRRQPFEWYRTCEHRFNSEFGFQSFPEPSVVNSYTRPGDRNITSFIMEHHQRSRIGNDAIIQYMADWFLLPKNFDMTLWLSQILQGMAMKYAVEHWRRKMPQGMGTLYWQLNDCWPVASWSSIDYEGGWKALHYMAKRFYAPILVSAVEDLRRGAVEIYVTNDRLEASKAAVQCHLTDTSGSSLRRDSLKAVLPARKSQRIAVLKYEDEISEYGDRNLLLWLELRVNGRVLSENLVTFVRPKHLNLMNPEIRVEYRGGREGSCEAVMEARHPALWVWPELAGAGTAGYSNRFFHLPPGRSVSIAVQPDKPLGLREVEKRMKIFSLVDTYLS